MSENSNIRCSLESQASGCELKMRILVLSVSKGGEWGIMYHYVWCLTTTTSSCYKNHPVKRIAYTDSCDSQSDAAADVKAIQILQGIGRLFLILNSYYHQKTNFFVTNRPKLQLYAWMIRIIQIHDVMYQIKCNLNFIDSALSMLIFVLVCCLCNNRWNIGAFQYVCNVAHMFLFLLPYNLYHNEKKFVSIIIK